VSPLAGDRPEEALDEIRNGIANWSEQGFHTQHWWTLISHCDILLYQHRGAEAWGLIERNWPALKTSMLLRIQYFLIESLYHRANSSLAMAEHCATNKGRKRQLVEAASRDAARIERENAPWGNGLARLVRAGVFAAQHRLEKAELLFRAAEEALESADMHLFAASARRRRGELIKGEQGASLVQVAGSCMRQQGILAPEHITAMLTPGR
jgi:hypothetical protein